MSIRGSLTTDQYLQLRNYRYPGIFNESTRSKWNDDQRVRYEDAVYELNRAVRDVRGIYSEAIREIGSSSTHVGPPVTVRDRVISEPTPVPLNRIMHWNTAWGMVSENINDGMERFGQMVSNLTQAIERSRREGLSREDYGLAE